VLHGDRGRKVCLDRTPVGQYMTVSSATEIQTMNFGHEYQVSNVRR
jgi:hypothetical protein